MSACTTCGACCVSFKVDFAIEEYEEAGGSVPAGLASPITQQLCRMCGTDHSPPRCAALYGKTGEQALCGIYEWRPSPCREFAEGSEACVRARRLQGLSPLTN
jgi:Fe-S-cluster containining protein